ncbi:hypothetical protein GNZ12_13735 [Paraburkholderia sp. 1N]|uniref:Uncharacterized protein n=1 Tax=Paraburkholderia solitsugae TaxID=2675748 RepID=A0ABX2BN46_9BURK|nr:hypothetical protein [Paraburkholderia solitsugae]NPT42354.1 hypothetical protein [Paraburkholderia solitsugae]
MTMDFNHAMLALEEADQQCLYTDQRDIGVWTAAMSRARSVLAQLQAAESDAKLHRDDNGAFDIVRQDGLASFE